jgi:hypothetical protein
MMRVSSVDVRDLVNPSGSGVSCVRVRSVEPQKSSHTGGMLRHVFSTGACSPALGKEAGKPKIFIESCYTKESTVYMDCGDSDIRQCVCAILSCDP